MNTPDENTYWSILWYTACIGSIFFYAAISLVAKRLSERNFSPRQRRRLRHLK